MSEIIIPLEKERFIDSLKSFEKNNDNLYEFDIYRPEEDLFYYDEKKEIIKDDDDMVNESEINSHILNFHNKKGLEGPGIFFYDSFFISKESDNEEIYIIDDKYINKIENLNKKEKESIDYGIRNKKEENTFNTFNEKSKDILNLEIIKKENIVENNIIDKINFNTTKVKNGLFNTFYLFSPLTSLEGIKLENKNYQRKFIRNKIKEIKEAIKEKKKEKITYSFNQNIFFISKEKNLKKNKKEGKKRKFCADNIMTKIKSRFLKAVISCLHKNLECANSEKYFSLFPRCFVKDITRKGNGISVLNMTFEELIKKDFYKEYKKKDGDSKMLNKKRYNNIKEEKIISNKEIEHNPDIEKNQENIKTIIYLENNKEISNRINFDNIKKRTYSDLFKEYLESHEFEESILDLLNETDVTQKYIIDYIIKAFEYIDYFSKSNKK